MRGVIEQKTKIGPNSPNRPNKRVKFSDGCQTPCLLEGHLIEGARDGFTALLTEKFKLTKTFNGFQKIDLTYNVEDANNWVITELWDSKEDYQKYLQFPMQVEGTLDVMVTSICEDAPSVRIFDIVDTA